jgi:probable rRNA maturation factor
LKTVKSKRILFLGETVSVFSGLKNNLIIPKSFKKIPFEKLKNDILGKKYELSIVLIGKSKAKTLNTKYRQKNYATDVLSFNVAQNLGEIFITPAVAKIKSKKFAMTYENYLLFLVIHASLHLKGLEHGDKMEQYELAYYDRYRHRHL